MSGLNIPAGIGMAGAAMANGPAPTERPAFEVTHIEIRRVQNGFLVAGINMSLYHRNVDGMDNHPRISYVAKDVAEIAAILEWFTTGKDVGWLPTINLPLFDMMHRPGMRPEEVKEAVKQGIAEAAAPQVVYNPNIMEASHDRLYGGPLNRGKG